MKKIIVALTLMLACALAFAIPSPKLIEDALAAQKYADAKAMVAEVLREKPDSARAHLMNAFILVHADKNRLAAKTELDAATALDKKGDVKNSPLYGRVVAEIDMLKTAQPVVKAVASPNVLPPAKPTYAPAPSYAQTDPSTTQMFLVIGGSLLAAGLIFFLIIRANRQSEREVRYVIQRDDYDSGYRSSLPEPTRPAPTMPSVRPPRETVVRHEYVNQPAVAPVMASGVAGAGMGAFGTAAAVAGGVVAGELLHDALTHRGSSHSSRGYDSYADPQRPNQTRVAEPVYEPSPVTYEEERQSFSSSSSGSSSWSDDSSSSSYSSSDSGSSSSWDSGSSDGGSSSDWD